MLRFFEKLRLLFKTMLHNLWLDMRNKVDPSRDMEEEHKKFVGRRPISIAVSVSGKLIHESSMILEDHNSRKEDMYRYLLLSLVFVVFVFIEDLQNF